VHACVSIGAGVKMISGSSHDSLMIYERVNDNRKQCSWIFFSPFVCLVAQRRDIWRDSFLCKVQNL